MKSCRRWKEAASSTQLPPIVGSGDGRVVGVGADHPGNPRVRLCRVPAVRRVKRGDYVDRGPAAEEQQQRSRAGLPVRWHQRGAHQSPVATAGAESRRQQFLIPLQRSERGSAGGRPRVGCDGHPGRKGLAARRQPLDHVEPIDGRDRTQVWGEQYVSKAADLFQVSAVISRDVAARLRVQPAAGQPRSSGTPEMRNPEAYELLLKGHFHRAKGRQNGKTGRKRPTTSLGLSPPIRVTRSPTPICRHPSESREVPGFSTGTITCRKRGRRRRRRSNWTMVSPMGITRWRIS